MENSPIRPFVAVGELRGDFGAHSDKLFGGRGMNSDGGIKLRLGRAAIKRYSQALNYFAGVGANHVTAQNFVGQAIDDEFHHGALIAAGEGMFERPEESP